jgi:hypothetical protein
MPLSPKLLPLAQRNRKKTIRAIKNQCKLDATPVDGASVCTSRLKNVRGMFRSESRLGSVMDETMRN